MKVYRYFLKHSGGVVDVLSDKEPKLDIVSDFGRCIVHRGQIGERQGTFWAPENNIAGTVSWEVEEGETL